MFRFHKLRAPDASLATGLFLAVLLPPTVNLVAAGAVAVAATVFRHVVRVGGRPVFNPAVVGVLAGALFFGMAPAWWAAIAIWLVVPLGLVLTLRTPGSWRVPAGFLAAYASLSAFGKVLLGTIVAPQVLLLGALDPSVLFFGFFMVPEPRTSPTDTGQRWLFGALVGAMTALLPAVFPSLAPLVALVLGNVVAAFLRRSGVPEPAPVAKAQRASRQRGGKRRRKPSRKPAISETRPEWQAAQRIGAGFAVVVLLGATSLALSVPHTTPFTTFRPTLPGGGSTPSALAVCASDNASIPADTLSYLHNRLGPSKILYQDPNSGTVVFYDPVNNATVTETDMYEDFGYAEFNGDDYAVAGCAP